MKLFFLQCFGGSGRVLETLLIKMELVATQLVRLKAPKENTSVKLYSKVSFFGNHEPVSQNNPVTLWAIPWRNSTTLQHPCCDAHLRMFGRHLHLDSCASTKLNWTRFRGNCSQSDLWMTQRNSNGIHCCRCWVFLRCDFQSIKPHELNSSHFRCISLAAEISVEDVITGEWRTFGENQWF